MKHSVGRCQLRQASLPKLMAKKRQTSRASQLPLRAGLSVDPGQRGASSAWQLLTPCCASMPGPRISTPSSIINERDEGRAADSCAWGRHGRPSLRSGTFSLAMLCSGSKSSTTARSWWSTTSFLVTCRPSLRYLFVHGRLCTFSHAWRRRAYVCKCLALALRLKPMFQVYSMCEIIGDSDGQLHAGVIFVAGGGGVLLGGRALPLLLFA